MGNLTNQSLIEFWDYEFPSIPENAVLPIVNKLSAFLAPTSDLERIFSTPENDLDFPAILNGQKILIVNLAKGVLGDEPSRLLGGFITTGIQQAALARASLPPEKRKDFYFYVDEFQNYTVASFESILAESAKYRLNLSLANQALGQLPSSLERAIFGNVATLISFQVSAEDAPKLRKEMHHSRTMVRPPQENEYVSLSDFVAYQKETYSEALNDKFLGMSREERGRIKRQRRASYSGGFLSGASAELDVQRQLSGRRGEIERALSLLDQGNLDVPLLRELFPDFEFRQISFPEVDDFLNLQPYHAFCRIAQADNVYAIRCLPAPVPSAERQEEILRFTKSRTTGIPVQASPMPSEKPEEVSPPQERGTPKTAVRKHERVIKPQDITEAQARKGKRPRRRDRQPE